MVKPFPLYRLLLGPFAGSPSPLLLTTWPVCLHCLQPGPFPTTAYYWGPFPMFKVRSPLYLLLCCFPSIPYYWDVVGLPRVLLTSQINEWIHFLGQERQTGQSINVGAKFL